MMKTSRWLSAVGVLCACAGPPVGTVRTDVGATTDTNVDAAVEDTVDAGASDAADDHVRVDVVDAGMAVDIPVDRPDAEMPMDRPDAGNVVDVPDAGDVVDVPDAGREDVVSPRPQITFSFVSAALQGSNDAGVRMNAVIQWHGSLRGQSADGNIRFEGVIR